MVLVVGCVVVAIGCDLAVLAVAVAWVRRRWR